jgi:hypothetical protein
MLFAQRPREAVKEVHGFSGDLPRRKSKKDNAPIQVRGQAEESKAIIRDTPGRSNSLDTRMKSCLWEWWRRTIIRTL